MNSIGCRRRILTLTVQKGKRHTGTENDKEKDRRRNRDNLRREVEGDQRTSLKEVGKGGRKERKGETEEILRLGKEWRRISKLR